MGETLDFIKEKWEQALTKMANYQNAVAKGGEGPRTLKILPKHNGDWNRKTWSHVRRTLSHYNRSEPETLPHSTHEW